VIVPTRNEEAIIGKNIKKLDEFLKKNFRDYEIVVSDKSEDSTPGIIRDMQKKNRRIKFLEAGKKAFNAALSAVKPGNFVYDISQKMEDAITLFEYTPIRDLMGHGIGRDLHEFPPIPCFISEKRENTSFIEEYRAGEKNGTFYMYSMLYSSGGRISFFQWMLQRQNY